MRSLSKLLKMRDFPSCFGENGVQVADYSSSSSSSSSSGTKTGQNLVTCVYESCIRRSFCLITIAWSKNMMGQGLNVGIDDSAKQSICKVDIKPWLFSKKKGSKSIESRYGKIDIYWDLSNAKFRSGPEPVEGFYVSIVADKQMILLLGDLKKEAFKKSNSNPFPVNSVFVAKREHTFGKRVFSTKAQFCNNGRLHDLVIECDHTIGENDPCLVIRMDCKTIMQVKRLRWKFRGNHTILVDGMPVEVYWDVYNWLFGTSLGAAVFMFKTCPSAEKMWSSNQSIFDQNPVTSSFSQRFVDLKQQSLGFSLNLYAWKNE